MLSAEALRRVHEEMRDYAAIAASYTREKDLPLRDAYLFISNAVKAALENSTNTVTTNAGASGHTCTGLPGECLTCYWEEQKK